MDLDLGLCPLLIWPQSGAAAWAGAHMLRRSHRHCSVVWEALLFLFFAYVYFLKGTTIIFTMKGSSESPDFSEQHSWLRAPGGQPCAARWCVSGEDDPGLPGLHLFEKSVQVVRKMEPVLRIPRARQGSSRVQQHPGVPLPPLTGCLACACLLWCFLP